MTGLLLKRLVKSGEQAESAEVRERCGKWSGLVGIFCNVLLSALKFVIGTITHSIAITADAFNNLSDVASSVVTLAGFKMAYKPADKEHPFGHGRFEYISGFTVSIIILLLGLELIKSSVEKIIHPEEIVFSVPALCILVFSILLKLGMCFFNRALAAKIRSEALKATSMDSLTDSIATFAILLSVLMSHFFGWKIDGYIGILVALFIIFTGVNTARDTIGPLLGQEPDPNLIEKIKTITMSYEEILGMHDLVVHNYGPGRVFASLHAEVSARGDILKSHDVIDLCERELQKKLGILVVIHMDPIEVDNEQVNSLKSMVVSIIGKIDPVLSLHDFRIVSGESHTNLIFDVVVPFSLMNEAEAIKQNIQEKVWEYNENYYCVINIDNEYT